MYVCGVVKNIILILYVFSGLSECVYDCVLTVLYDFTIFVVISIAHF